MRRSKLSNWWILLMALVLLGFYWMLEAAVRPMVRFAYGESLLLDIASKVLLAFTTGSMFFLVTEGLRDIKKKDSASDVQLTFLQDIRKIYNTHIESWKHQYWEPDRVLPDHLTQTTAIDIDLLINQWATDRIVEFKMGTREGYLRGAAGRIWLLSPELRQKQRDIVPYQGSISMKFTKEMHAMLDRLDAAFVGWPERLDLHVAMGILDRLRSDIIALINLYNEEHDIKERLKSPNKY